MNPDISIKIRLSRILLTRLDVIEVSVKNNITEKSMTAIIAGRRILAARVLNLNI
jgi:hypothetical protein